MIAFRIDPDSGLPPYWQLVRQVRQAMRLGLLSEGERLPTVRETASRLGINQNTVLKAYRELEYSGLVAAQAGVGTFIHATLVDASLAAHGPLREQLLAWLAAARDAGLDEESIQALIEATLRSES